VRTSLRLFVIASLAVALLLSIPLVASAAWPAYPTLEKFSADTGARLFEMSKASLAGGLSSDSAGNVFVCTSVGFNIYKPSGALKKSVNRRA